MSSNIGNKYQAKYLQGKVYPEQFLDTAAIKEDVATSSSISLTVEKQFSQHSSEAISTDMLRMCPVQIEIATIKI